MVDKLVKCNAISLDKVHLIGHSLGAHVMGIAGSLVKSGRVPHITGLDPANPGFEYISYESDRLDSSDAEFVDVIHTAAGAAGYYGLLGHADFYPNGGTPPQPGCADLRNPTKIFGCSHGRSYEYYAESVINPKGFRSVKCDSWSAFSNGSCANHTVAYMGANVSTDTRGTFYLETNAESPFAKG
ncbi:pancreatic lipase-related protein 3-like isoform X2 [Rhodnius prolixus]